MFWPIMPPRAGAKIMECWENVSKIVEINVPEINQNMWRFRGRQPTYVVTSWSFRVTFVAG